MEAWVDFYEGQKNTSKVGANKGDIILLVSGLWISNFKKTEIIEIKQDLTHLKEIKFNF